MNTSVRAYLVSSLRLVLAAAMVLPAANAAERVEDLYVVEVGVADQSADARAEGSSRGLGVLLTRLTGLTELPTNPALVRAFDDAERYATRYSYRSRIRAGQRERLLRLQFAPGAVQALLREAELPVWGSRRSVVAVWLVAQQDDERLLVTDPGTTEFEHAAGALHLALQEAADRRGVPLRFPAANDELLAGLVLDGEYAELQLESRLLEADFQIAGRVVVELDGVSARSFLQTTAVDGDPGRDRVSARGADVQAVADRLLDQIAERLASAFAVRTGSLDGIALRIRGVDDVTEYAGLMKYLHSLEYLDDIEITRLTSGYVEVFLTTSAGHTQLERLLNADGRLLAAEPQADTFGLGAEFVWH